MSVVGHMFKPSTNIIVSDLMTQPITLKLLQILQGVFKSKNKTYNYSQTIYTQPNYDQAFYIDTSETRTIQH